MEERLERIEAVLVGIACILMVTGLLQVIFLGSMAKALGDIARVELPRTQEPAR